MSELRRGVLRVGSNYMRLGLMIILGLLTVPILLSGVGSVGFGLWGLLGATVGLGDLFKEIVQASMNRELGEAFHSHDESRFKRVFNSALLVAAIAAVLGLTVYAALYLLIPVLSIDPAWQDAAVRILISQAIASGVSIVAAPYFNLYLASERTGSYNAWLVVERCSYFLSAVLWVYLMPAQNAQETLVAFSWTGAVIGMVVTVAASIMMMTLDHRTHPRPQLIQRAEVFSIISTSGWNGVMSAALNMHIRLDQMLMNLWFGLAGNAVFSACVRLSSYVRMVTTGMTDGLDVVAARLNSTNQLHQMERILPRITSMHALVALPSGLIVFVYADVLLGLWVGKQFTPEQLASAATIVRILVIGMACRGISDGWTRVLYGAGFIKRYAPVVVLGGVLNPILAFVLYRILPVSTGSSRWLADQNSPALAFAGIFVLIHFLWLGRLTSRCLRVSLAGLYKPLIRPVVATVLLGGAAGVLRTALPITGAGAIAVHVSVLGCLTLFLLLTIGLSSVERDALWRLVRPRFQAAINNDESVIAPGDND